VLAAVLFGLACLTDVVDGHLARSRGQVTDFGVMADPIADKALVGTALSGCRCSAPCPGGPPRSSSDGRSPSPSCAAPWPVTA
jgi:hypothetical protein